MGAGWYVKDVAVRRVDENDVATDQDAILFPCNRWLDTKEGDKKIDVVFSSVASQSIWTVKVFTGDKFGAGTDSNVFLTLMGQVNEGGVVSFTKTERVKLAESKEHKYNKFERGQCDTFEIAAKHSLVSHFKGILLEMEPSGLGVDWYLDRIQLSCGGSSFEFTFEKWLTRKELSVEAVLPDSVEVDFKPKSKTFLQKGPSKPRQVEKQLEFHLKKPPGAGALRGVELSHDNSGRFMFVLRVSIIETVGD